MSALPEAWGVGRRGARSGYENGNQFFGIKGFGEVGVCAGFVALNAIARHAPQL